MLNENPIPILQESGQRPILVIDNYDSFTYNLVQLLKTMYSGPVEVRRNDQIDFVEILEMNPAGIVISPGPGSPKNEADFGVNLEVIQKQIQLDCPILGVCLGHQGIAFAFGAEVGSAVKIMHGKTSKVELDSTSKLFSKLGESLEVMRYHSLAVKENTMPACLRVTARDIESGEVMALEHRTAQIYGIQFHPESIGTPRGSEIISNFLEICRMSGRNSISEIPARTA